MTEVPTQHSCGFKRSEACRSLTTKDYQAALLSLALLQPKRFKSSATVSLHVNGIFLQDILEGSQQCSSFILAAGNPSKGPGLRRRALEWVVEDGRRQSINLWVEARTELPSLLQPSGLSYGMHSMPDCGKR